MRTAEVVVRLAERWVPVAAVALRCPRCRADDGLVVRLHSAAIGRCVYCGWRASLRWLLAPEREQRDREIKWLMKPEAEVIY